MDLGRHGALRRSEAGVSSDDRHRAAAPRRRALPGDRPRPLHDDRARGARALQLDPARAAAIPIHYEGWTHFKEGRAASGDASSRDAPEERPCAGFAGFPSARRSRSRPEPLRR